MKRTRGMMTAKLKALRNEQVQALQRRFGIGAGIGQALSAPKRHRLFSPR